MRRVATLRAAKEAMQELGLLPQKRVTSQKEQARNRKRRATEELRRKESERWKDYVSRNRQKRKETGQTRYQNERALIVALKELDVLTTENDHAISRNRNHRG
jgi:hypothetical protein